MFYFYFIVSLVHTRLSYPDSGLSGSNFPRQNNVGENNEISDRNKCRTEDNKEAVKNDSLVFIRS
jgi:hypothetical protein